jgi:hypothetical protein
LAGDEAAALGALVGPLGDPLAPPGFAVLRGGPSCGAASAGSAGSISTVDGASAPTMSSLCTGGSGSVPIVPAGRCFGPDWTAEHHGRAIDAGTRAKAEHWSATSRASPMSTER